MVLPREAEEQVEQRACDAMCGFRRYNRSRTRAGGGPPAQDITSDTLQLAPSAPQHCHSRGGQQASQFSLCLTLWYFSHRKVYVFMWLKLQIFPLYGSRASFLTKSLFPQDPQSPASGDNCRASAWFPGHAPAGRTRTSRPSCSSQARTLCGQDAVGCHRAQGCGWGAGHVAHGGQEAGGRREGGGRDHGGPHGVRRG